jgi:hypothetical protein
LFNHEEVTREEFIIELDSLKRLYNISIVYSSESKNDNNEVQLRSEGPTVHTANATSWGLIEENQLVRILPGNALGLYTGIYVCDIYMVVCNVTLPEYCVAQTVASPNCGYADASAQIRDISAGYQAGTLFQMTSYVLRVNYNMLGQQILGWDPCQPSSAQFNYIYGTLVWN